MLRRLNEHRINRAAAALLVTAALGVNTLTVTATATARQDPGAAAEMPLVPENVLLHPAVQTALDAAWRTDDERATLRINHGIWQPEDITTVEARARVALNAGRYGDAVWDDPAAPAHLVAEAHLLAGRADDALHALGRLDSIRADRIRAEAHMMLGEFDAASKVVSRPVRQLQQQATDDPDDLTEGVRALFLRSRLQGQPTRDYQTMLNLLSRAHQELDRLHWPSRLAEAELLVDKSNAEEAVAALHEVLRLNPRCADAWYLLGRIALEQFDFGSAQRAVAHLRQLHREHPLAMLLLAESVLIQNDPETALALTATVLERYPLMRDAHALQAAAFARRYDEVSMRQALRRHDELSPGSAEAHYIVGKHLSFDRQYEDAAALLREAIRRQPHWPAPQIELGLLLLQSGDDEEALDVLRRVAELDRFNKRAANSLVLLEELTGFETIETEHFIIRYKPGIDQVLVEMMPDRLEQIHRVVSERYQHEPDRKTIIEVMPDHQWFAVRITGMPHVHTIAACTGPLIAMEVPREGPRRKHLGTFDWPRVIQHEYAHTITLSQTRNRIPHWLTEAAAVRMEQRPRDYETEQLLARAYETDTLFDFEEINWAFVRPRRATDRAQAYAQGAWMVEFMDERFGEQALIELMEQYFEGRPEREAMLSVFGMPREQFYEAFHEWAGEQIRAWGFGVEPKVSALVDAVRQQDPDLVELTQRSAKARMDVVLRELVDRIGRPRTSDERMTAEDWPPVAKPPVDVTDAMLNAWLDAHPDHPDLLELKVRRMDEADRGGDRTNRDDFIERLERYVAARPGDLYPHRRLADLYLSSDAPHRAIPHLDALDLREQKSPVFAIELARLYRERGDLDRALVKATRALHINPYHAANRELAAAIAVQQRDLATARRHLVALTLIEPDRAQHERRLEAIDRLLNAS